MTNHSPSVYIFCALVCEAKPLIKAWRLKKNVAQDHPFVIYSGNEKVVVISGIGKVNMASAVAYAMALDRNLQCPVLINLGIAGHRSKEVGELYLGHKVCDEESGRCFYPAMPFGVPCATQSVITASRPRSDYKEEGLFDMEAAGFYEVAVKFSSSELIQVVKVVSDNSISPVTNITEQSVEGWIDQKLPIIDGVVERLLHMKRQTENVENSVYLELLGEFHFTVSRSLKLKALLRRWCLLKGEEPLAWRDAGLRDAKAVLVWVEQQLDEVEFYL